MHLTCPAFANSRGQNIAVQAMPLAVLVHVTDMQRMIRRTLGTQMHPTVTQICEIRSSSVIAVSRFDTSKMS